MAAAIMAATLHLATLIAAVCCVCNEWCDDAIWVCCFKSKMRPKEFNSNMYACMYIYLLSLTAHISCRHPWSQSVISGRQPLQRSLRGQDWKYLSSAVAGFKELWGWVGGGGCTDLNPSVNSKHPGAVCMSGLWLWFPPLLPCTFSPFNNSTSD